MPNKTPLTGARGIKMSCQSRRRACGVTFTVATLYKKFTEHGSYVTDRKSVSFCKIIGLNTCGVIKRKYIRKQDNVGPVPDHGPRHEGVRWDCGIVQRVLNFGTRFR